MTADAANMDGRQPDQALEEDGGMPTPKFALSMDDFGFPEDEDGTGRILNQAEIDSLFGSDATLKGEAKEMGSKD